MGIRIHKAMGWGLTEPQMQEHAAFDFNPDDVGEALWDHLWNIKDLTLPLDVSARFRYNNREELIFTRNLLNKEFKFDADVPTFESAEDLHKSVYTFGSQLGIEGEGTKLHLFAPCGVYAKKWFRFNDDLDYAECCLDDASTDPDPVGKDVMLDRIVEMRHNPYPYTNNLMDAEGNSVKWTTYGRNLRPELLPEPPLELVWWLTEYKVIKPGSWIHLRPYFARWWC